ncbi:hypothetical protein [Streptomyces malaysiensis]|nr:hypothetical protein [Streptomyces malaysiensis]
MEELAAGGYPVIAVGCPAGAAVHQVTGGGRTERDPQLGHEN